MPNLINYMETSNSFFNAYGTYAIDGSVTQNTHDFLADWTPNQETRSSSQQVRATAEYLSEFRPSNEWTAPR